MDFEESKFVCNRSTRQHTNTLRFPITGTGIYKNQQRGLYIQHGGIVLLCRGEEGSTKYYTRFQCRVRRRRRKQEKTGSPGGRNGKANPTKKGHYPGMAPRCTIQPGRSAKFVGFTTGIDAGGAPPVPQGAKGSHQSGIRPAGILCRVAFQKQNRRILSLDLYNRRRRLGTGGAGCPGNRQYLARVTRPRNHAPPDRFGVWRERWSSAVSERRPHCARFALAARYHHCSGHHLCSGASHVFRPKAGSKPHGKSHGCH
mmetsp:Transcript_618/g.1399  ORF Transcript_618/g.1399 Transcript_618/m.1399 type:complete len:257 (-) Transcript_618:678-1448(-)